MPDIINLFSQANEGQKYVLELAFRIALFLLCATISPLVGKTFPGLLNRIMQLIGYYTKTDGEQNYIRFIKPFQNFLNIIGTLLFLSICLNLLAKYQDLYTFLGFLIYLSLALFIVWFASKAARPIIRGSIVKVAQRWFGEVNEVVLIFETLIYFLIFLLAVVIFAQGLRLSLITLGASLGIGGVAIAFAAQQALERLIGTLELYLDRPYVPGEYIRVTFNPYGEDVYGRVESIGLRSTKIRIVAKNTLMIVPNSNMAGLHVENVSRGKKIMAMICLDFFKNLTEGEQALVIKTIEDTSQTFWGFDKATTKVQFIPQEQQENTRARVIFFITGSGENSLGLRKRLLELANNAIARRLVTHNLRFRVPEPMIYIDSPMSI